MLNIGFGGHIIKIEHNDNLLDATHKFCADADNGPVGISVRPNSAKFQMFRDRGCDRWVNSADDG